MTVADDLRVLIVDDEELSRSLLSSIVGEATGYVVADVKRNGREAIESLQRESFDIVFLDIQMPGLTGIEVVERTQADRLPAVIFATAFDEFACRAFDLHAVDYVLKPFDPERVTLALTRAQDRVRGEGWVSGKETPIGAIADLRAATPGVVSPTSSDYGKLPIKDGGHTHLLPHNSIEWIDAAGDYMCVHAEGNVHILRSTMKDLETKLSADFVRIHRSTIVNVRKVRAVDTLPKGECLLHLDNDVTVRVSRNYRAAIQHLLT